MVGNRPYYDGLHRSLPAGATYERSPFTMVRAVGIEPTLLAERDFQWDETTADYRRNQPSKRLCSRAFGKATEISRFSNANV